MSVIAPPSALVPPAPSPRLLTIADVAALPTSLPSGDVSYELDDGRLIVMAPPGGMHGSGQARFATELTVQGERQGHGRAFAEVGIVLRRNPDRLVGADAAFVAARSLPFRLSPEGYLETIPELAVEIRSKNDTTPEILRKVAEYLAAGVVAVWLVDPDRQSVTEYRSGQPAHEFTSSDTLTIPDVIPGFHVAVSSLFA